MRVWKYEGRELGADEVKFGRVEALGEEEALKKLRVWLDPASIKLEDCGPIGHFLLTNDRDAFRAATEEQYAAAVVSGEAFLKVVPSDNGRVWSLYLPVVSPQLLKSVFYMMEGGEERGSSSPSELVIPTSMGLIHIGSVPSPSMGHESSGPKSRSDYLLTVLMGHAHVMETLLKSVGRMSQVPVPLIALIQRMYRDNAVMRKEIMEYLLLDSPGKNI